MTNPPPPQAASTSPSPDNTDADAQNLATASRLPIRRALISVSDRTGLVDLGRVLVAAGVELVATGTTARVLRDAGLTVAEVAEVTGFPEILGGRVKTLHPAIHGGILSRQDPASAAVLTQHGIDPFDLVVVNLYPFERTLLEGGSPAECIEQIDIGGPTLIRAAAKTCERVSVLVDPQQYASLAGALNAGGTTFDERRNWAARAFQRVADYDVAIATWMTEQSTGSTVEGASANPLPEWIGMSFSQEEALRYGENPHQEAALYSSVSGADTTGGLAAGTLLGGKPLSYNNLQDTQAALRAVEDFPDAAAVAIIKHANPCGMAVSATVAEAYRHALACDPLSAFGGVVASNREVDEGAALEIAKIFTEVVVAPSFTEGALGVLREKKALRILQVDPHRQTWGTRPVDGGLLVQGLDRPSEEDRLDRWDLVAGPAATAAQARDLEFAWRACQHVKSNAIVLVRDEATVGVGMGQVNRVDSAKLAVQRANSLAPESAAAGERDRSKGSVAASDAFFPFPDGLEVLIDAGVTAVVAPGGSRNDQLCVEAARASGITLYFTKRRHFAH